MLNPVAWIPVLAVALVALVALGSLVSEAKAQVSIVASDRTEAGVQITFEFDWDVSLSAFVDSTDIGTWTHSNLAAVSGGLLTASHVLELPSKSLPEVQLLAREYDEYPVAIREVVEDPWTERPAVWASGLGTSRKQHLVNVVTMPYRLNQESGSLERLRRLVVWVAFTDNPDTTIPISASQTGKRVVDSVLSDGMLFRISIREDGVYRITRGLLTSLGQNPDTIDPNDVQLFANGGRP